MFDQAQTDTPILRPGQGQDTGGMFASNFTLALVAVAALAFVGGLALGMVCPGLLAGH